MYIILIYLFVLIIIIILSCYLLQKIVYSEESASKNSLCHGLAGEISDSADKRV